MHLAPALQEFLEKIVIELEGNYGILTQVILKIL
jgi:hypothetical protein